MIEVILFEEVVRCFVAAVDQHSQLKVIELVFLLTAPAVDGLNEGCLCRVVFQVYCCGAVEAEKDAIVDTDVVNLVPA